MLRAALGGIAGLKPSIVMRQVPALEYVLRDATTTGTL